LGERGDGSWELIRLEDDQYMDWAAAGADDSESASPGAAALDCSVILLRLKRKKNAHAHIAHI
jgi:hypothetical protein